MQPPPTTNEHPLRQQFLQLGRRLKGWLAQSNISESAIIMGTAVIVGALTGLAALLLRYLIGAVHTFSFATAAGWLAAVQPLHLILLPALGGLLVGYLTTYGAQEARGPGIPEVMEAVAVHQGWIRPRVAVVKALAAAATIGSGGSAGREGPIAHIGSALGSMIGRFLRLPDDQVKNLVACGAAGGIAATFNAPIAGSLFALEVILGHFHATYFGAVVISAVVADVVLNLFEGNTRAFLVPEYALISPWELLLYALLGLLAAPLAIMFVKLVEFSSTQWERLSVNPVLKPMLGGVVLGVLGVLTFKSNGIPRIFGVGYETISDVLFGQALPISMIAALLLLKMAATAVTLGSGGSGGVFAPSLFIGAMWGSAFGLVANQLFPEITAAPGAYALVGMAAFVSGAVHTPVTIIVMLFELTGDYQIILPLMVATVMGTVASYLFGHESMYTSKLSRRGVHLHRGKDIDVMEGITVGEVMSPIQQSVPLDMSLSELAQTFELTHSHGFPVVNAAGQLAGAVSIGDYERAQMERDVSQLCVADIATLENLVVATPEEPMSRALRRFALQDISRIPVVAEPESRRLIGIIRRSDIIRAYQSALVKRAHYQHRIEQLSLEKPKEATFAEIELDAPSWATGRRLSEIGLPEACLVVSVRRGNKLFVAQGHTIMQLGDKVTVFGLPETIRTAEDRLKQLTPPPNFEPHTPRHRELIVPSGSFCCGKQVQELQLPRDCLVVSIRRGNNILVPHGDTILRAGDVIELFGMGSDLRHAEETLTLCRIGKRPSALPSADDDT